MQKQVLSCKSTFGKYVTPHELLLFKNKIISSPLGKLLKYTLLCVITNYGEFLNIQKTVFYNWLLGNEI